MLAVALLLTTLTACKDDDRGGNGSSGGSGSGNQLTSITLVEEGITEMVLELNWNGSALDRVNVKECTSAGQLRNTAYAQANYNNQGLIESILLHSYEKGGDTYIDLFYGNGQLEELRADGQSYFMHFDNQGLLSSITDANGQGITLSWSGGNFTRITSDGETVRLSYNGLTFPLNALLSSAGIGASLNCPTSIISPDGDNISIDYESNSGLPSVATINYGDNDGSMQIYFRYADGTGGQAPAPVAAVYVYWHAYNYSGGYVEDQNGNRNAERRLAVGSTLTLSAVPYSGYSFSGWTDGNTQNPRTITVNNNVTEYAAIFTSDGGGGSSSGNSVSFNYTNWSNVYVLGDKFTRFSQANNTLLGRLFSVSNPSSYSEKPWMKIQLENLTNGSNYYNINTENGVINGDYTLIEYCENSYLTSTGSDGTTSYYGDWWGKYVNVDVTSYNFGTHTFTLNLYGTFYDAYDHFVNGTAVSECATRWVDVQLTNVSFEEYSSSKSPFTKSHSHPLAQQPLRKNSNQILTLK